jgi:hypothetical protein
VLKLVFAFGHSFRAQAGNPDLFCPHFSLTQG